MENEHFHGNCETTRNHTSQTPAFTNHGVKKEGHVKDQFCSIHKVVFCHCGWEWGFHYGTRSQQGVSLYNIFSEFSE